MMRRPLFVFVLLLGACQPGPPATPPSSLPTPSAGVANPSAVKVATPAGMPDIARAVPVDEALRAEYARCDREDSFRNLHFPLDENGHHWFRCSSDPSRLDRLVRLPASGNAQQAIVFTSKLALDLDGSWIGCHKPGHTDQCGTALMLPRTPSHPCLVMDDGPSRCVPVDADRVPYVVLPFAGPRSAHTTEFQEATKIHPGDLGMVIRDGHPPVPVIVADTGPFYKVGEGSLALHRALGNDSCTAHNVAGDCTSVPDDGGIGSGVTTIIFPGSRPKGLTPDTIAETVQQQGTQLYQQLLQAYPPTKS